MVAHAGWNIRQLDHLSIDIKLPSVIDATKPTFFVSTEKHVGASVRAASIHQTNPTLSVAKCDQLRLGSADVDHHAIGAGP